MRAGGQRTARDRAGSPLSVRNVTRGTWLMSAGKRAGDVWARVRGLIGSRPLQPGEGLWIVPCSGIHMLFMSYPIDALYLDRELHVVAVDHALRPWTLGRMVRGAHSVLELPAGSVAPTGTDVGDQLAIEPVEC